MQVGLDEAKSPKNQKTNTLNCFKRVSKTIPIILSSQQFRLIKQIYRKVNQHRCRHGSFESRFRFRKDGFLNTGGMSNRYLKEGYI